LSQIPTYVTAVPNGTEKVMNALMLPTTTNLPNPPKTDHGD